jgi:hypothetical protein
MQISPFELRKYIVFFLEVILWSYCHLMWNVPVRVKLIFDYCSLGLTVIEMIYQLFRGYA